ncbi:MAG: FadR family transcriptional regulator, partial [Lentisphaerae bacterium]|nr:FadR family transcriptional regulator [Lentisphaerota bacterium]
MIMKEVFSTTLADGIENSILTFIREKTLQPGDLLPREEEIADYLNVSRLSVREGLGRLKALGLVEPRKRRGTVL